jgi:hypothetical protein
MVPAAEEEANLLDAATGKTISGAVTASATEIEAAVSSYLSTCCKVALQKNVFAAPERAASTLGGHR